jgi:wyosine [tRNA(Phe)-imidazoG37] synthetase (radical SAM superfamily)
MAKHVFGPVLSRRLGRSLGVDLVIPKTCNMNCVFCECGPTPRLAEKRARFFPVEEVLTELTSALAQHEIDVVTFSGSGEPMLSLDLPVVLAFLKKNYPHLKTALITNGTLLGDEERAEILDFDYILPALHAADETVWKKIVRTKVPWTAVAQGLIKLRQEFKGHLNLEVFLIPGINDQITQIAPLAKILKQIRPDVIELNSLDRPGALAWVRPCPRTTLQAWADELQALTGIKTTIIAKQTAGKAASPLAVDWTAAQAAAWNLLARRPATQEDLLQTTGLSAHRLQQMLQTWLGQHRIVRQGNFYCAEKNPPTLQE